VTRHRIVLALLVLIACAPSTPPGPSPVRAATDDELLRGLSRRDRIAQLVWPWIAGTYAPYEDETYTRTVARWVDSLHVGGVLVSVGGPLDVAAKLNDLQRRAPLPLLVASDLESGTSFRLVGGTPTPPNMAVGATGREADAFALGRITALEGRAVGIHLAFAPVADVNDNPDNPVINIRSFGEDPLSVSRLVAAAVRGLESSGIAATPKHFPGHGNTDIDTHLALPSLPASWQQLSRVELPPFRAAIEAGATGIMSAHISLPGLDAAETRPATLAPGILTGILHDSLGFRGVVFTDALNMGALVKNYTVAEIAVGALLSGADVLVQPADPYAVVDAIELAIREGRLSEARVERSVRKVLALKRRFGLFTTRTVLLDSVPARVGAPEFQRTADDIAARSIVLVRDSMGVVARLRASPQRVALVTYGDDRSPAVGLTLAAELRARGHAVTLARLWPNSGEASRDSARAALAASTTSIFAIAARPLPWDASRLTLPAPIARLVDSTATTRPTILVSLGSPYTVRSTPAVGSYLVGWLANPTMERAVAGALTGAAITGRLPVRIPPSDTVGGGRQLPASR
jgi:beta-N-acetylhexosaminidase